MQQESAISPGYLLVILAWTLRQEWPGSEPELAIGIAVFCGAHRRRVLTFPCLGNVGSWGVVTKILGNWLLATGCSPITLNRDQRSWRFPPASPTLRWKDSEKLSAYEPAAGPVPDPQ